MPPRVKQPKRPTPPAQSRAASPHPHQATPTPDPRTPTSNEATLSPHAIYHLQDVVGNRLISRRITTTTQPTPTIQRLTNEEKELFQAIEKDDLSGVMDALVKGANINARDDKQRTPLLRACELGREALIAYLINKAPDIDAQDAEGWTPLHNAVHAKSINIIQILIFKQARIDLVANTGETALAMAANRSTKEITQALFEYSQTVNRVLNTNEVEQVTGVFYKDTNIVTPTVRQLFADSFLDVVNKYSNLIEISFKPSVIAGYLHDYIALIYDQVISRVEKGKKQLVDKKDIAMANLGQQDLQRIKADALADCTDTPENVIKWIGHLTAQDDTIYFKEQRISLSGWSPVQALFYKCIAILHLLESGKFEENEIAYLHEELRQDVFAFERATELFLVEKFFVPLKIADTVSKGLAKEYLFLAAHVKSFRIPSGTRTHATYISGSVNDNNAEITQHNLGNMANKKHTSPKEYHYYPFLVKGIKTGDLAPVFEEMILKFVSLNLFSTGEVLEGLYNVLSSKGTPNIKKEVFEERFEPLLQQVANNCSIENLNSAGMELGLKMLQKNYGAFIQKFKQLELAFATKQAIAITDSDLVEDIVTTRNFAQQLRTAALIGDNKRAKELVLQDLNIVNLPDSDGRTALHFAAYHGNIDLVTFLMSKGANQKQQDKHGDPPIVTGKSHINIVKLFGKQYTKKKIKGYIFTPYEVTMYTRPGDGLIGSLESDDVFYVIDTMTDWLRIVFIDEQKVFVGYISPRYVVNL